MLNCTVKEANHRQHFRSIYRLWYHFLCSLTIVYIEYKSDFCFHKYRYCVHTLYLFTELSHVRKILCRNKKHEIMNPFGLKLCWSNTPDEALACQTASSGQSLQIWPLIVFLYSHLSSILLKGKLVLSF